MAIYAILIIYMSRESFTMRANIIICGLKLIRAMMNFEIYHMSDFRDYPTR